MRKAALFVTFAAVLALTAEAQWQIQDTHSTADLRGIDSLGNGVAWASGTHGTVLRTEDGGSVWQPCAVPPGGKDLDFRGVQGFNSKVALVISSGKGALSKVFKTVDGCQSWKEVFANPDETGFFDALRRVTSKQLFLLGDPVGGTFSLFTSRDAGDTWFIADDPGLNAPPGAGVFAASNSSFLSLGADLYFGTGAPKAAVYRTFSHCDAKSGICTLAWQNIATPLAHGTSAQGVFSLAGRFVTSLSGVNTSLLVAVGGNYEKPADVIASAAFSGDGGQNWAAAETMPGGYRSAVAYSPKTNTWITVGPNGTDISTDDGRNWRALKPDPKFNDAPDADSHWNALSLPFVVGPGGRIGILRGDALKAPSETGSK